MRLQLLAREHIGNGFRCTRKLPYVNLVQREKPLVYFGIPRICGHFTVVAEAIHWGAAIAHFVNFFRELPEVAVHEIGGYLVDPFSRVVNGSFGTGRKRERHNRNQSFMGHSKFSDQLCAT